MKRWLQTRLLIVLIALVLIPAATLPFAERLRNEWTKFWEPKPVLKEAPSVEPPLLIVTSVTVVIPERAYGRVWRTTESPDPSAPSPSSPLRFSEEQELGEMAGALRSIDLPTGRPE